MKTNYFPWILTLMFLTCPLRGWSSSVNSEEGARLLQDDQRRLDDVTKEYQNSVMKHGEYSGEARDAKNRLDAAQNKLEMDRHNVTAANTIDVETGNPEDEDMPQPVQDNVPTPANEPSSVGNPNSPSGTNP